MRKQTSKNNELKSSNKANTNKTPARVLVAGRLAFIRARLRLLNRMKATAVVNNGNTTSPIDLEIARGIFNSNRARTAYLSESQISGNSINPQKIESYLASLSNEAKELETTSSTISNHENPLVNTI